MERNQQCLLPGVTAAFAVGIWVAGLANWSLPFLYSVAGGVVLGTVFLAMKRMEETWPAALTVFLLAGMICALQAGQLRADDVSAYAGQVVQLDGRIDEPPVLSRLAGKPVQIKYTVAVDSIQLGSEHKAPASGRVAVSVRYPEETANSKWMDGGNQRAAYGDRLKVSGQLLAIRGYRNPGQLDPEIAARRQGVHGRMSARASDAVIMAGADSDNWRTGLAAWRERVRRDMEAVMPETDAAMICGMLFGGYDGIRREVIRDFSTTGIVHILSVSGTHIALVAGVIAWLGGRLGPRFRGLTGLTATAAVLLYAAVSGFTPPVVRSAFMGVLSLGAIALERDTYAAAALAAAALVMLTAQPLLLYDISFQLSFAATAGLVFLYRPTLHILNHLPSWMASPLAVTAAAQLAVAPFIAWYYNSFSLSAFAANLAIVPLAEAIVVLGLAGALISGISGSIAAMLYVICSLLTGIVTQLTSLLAAVPGGAVYLPSVGLVGGLAYYVFLIWIYGGGNPMIPSPLVIWKRFPVGVTGVLCLLVAVLILWNGRGQALSVHFIDVGQGDAVLVVTPGGRAVLVDTGGTAGMSNAFDVGERVVAPYLKHYGVRELEYLVLSHGHQDHAGGAAGVAGLIPVKNMVLAREQPALPVQAAIKKVGSVIPAYSGQEIRIDGVLFRMFQALEGGTSSRKQTAGNEQSCVLQLEYGRHTFLLTGDQEAPGEQQLLRSGKLQPVSVLKVGHHGSRTAASEEFLRATDPRYAIISVGYGNRFGHPHPDTLQRLKDHGTAIYRTDLDGAVVFHSDGEQLRVETYNEEKSGGKYGL
ncbi:MAG TPA: DNA internalization-related competence protein ComEC/Rec2 [Patescibacteria group bacterium]|nr:DNA internalization-related competence protein ComEC/Rec2 [Patescibacteria group bacterium]